MLLQKHKMNGYRPASLFKEEHRNCDGFVDNLDDETLRDETAGLKFFLLVLPRGSEPISLT